MDLGSFINKSGCECLNEADDHPLAHAFTTKGGYLESDCDEQIGPLKLSKCLAVSASAYLSRGTIAVTCHHESSPRIFKAASPRPIVITVIRHVTMIRGDRFIADLQSGRSSADRGSTVPECHGVSVTLAKIT
ncbi:uncharacterized protein, partial [Argopecten irradians]|uniref:uncharacterized protein n=1 Tax=Argopecten irradians TaxID=31199 RepID=UPI003720C739